MTARRECVSLGKFWAEKQRVESGCAKKNPLLYHSPDRSSRKVTALQIYPLLVQGPKTSARKPKLGWQASTRTPYSSMCGPLIRLLMSHSTEYCRAARCARAQVRSRVQEQHMPCLGTTDSCCPFFRPPLHAPEMVKMNEP